MRSLNAEQILPHQPPFRFIKEAFLVAPDRAMAAVPAVQPNVAWAAEWHNSVLPVEYAAQLVGVLIRSRIGANGASSVLAGVNEFTWDDCAQPLESVEVRYSGTRGEYHDFKADFLSTDSLVCGSLSGFLHMPPGQRSKELPLEANEPINEDCDIFDVYEIEEDGPNTVFKVYTRPDCPVFAGHFPGRPLTPGVLIAEMMVKAATRHHPNLGLHRLSNLVFSATLGPGEFAEIRLKQLAEMNFSATLMRQGKRMARAKIELAALPIPTNKPIKTLITTQG